MRKITISNFKGGVGKTTLAVNCAAGLSREGKHVLLIDLDAQMNSTQFLGVDGNSTPGSYGLIVDGMKPSDVIVKVDLLLDIIPASRALTPVDQWLTMQTNRERILKKRLSGLRGYDYVIIDTAPSFSLLGLNAMVYASELWLPVNMEFFALTGVEQIIETLDMIQDELDHTTPVKYVIPTFHDARNLKTGDVMTSLKKRFKKAVTVPIRTDVRLSEAPSHHQSIFDYSPRSRAATDFEKLVTRIMKDEKRTGRRSTT